MSKNGRFKIKKVDCPETLTEIHKTHCYVCNVYTDHRVLNSHSFIEEEYEDDNLFQTIYTRYQLIQCMGCSEIRFRFSYHWPDWTLDAEHIYPKSDFVRLDRRITTSDLPEDTYLIYNELVTAIENSLNLFSTVGCRLLIENICSHLNVRSGSLQEKINLLQKQNLISSNENELLQLIRKFGNKSAHEFKSIDSSKLRTIFLILEDVLIKIFLYPKRKNELNS